ncbi:hypothetical protein AGABI2DRAFT_194463 [Agaricus bisporus var. bisporus H97]|uniref:hypothetical protein n=1 Tax=Agaricus bisporus var. bisporus (strain H97 / ATCC MYA-4626 / FGSC 10389) TaxID=936046 RepID=UPI00029F7333|nr:hypothetical protein AGABI2DRAFT_194463 [Agaricus bisporus var. bisporus H97]EKV44392.1 hypothetical protein AGABI2DRAFT_194463 [Agaricus bisporus var. bisporus H97]
MEYLSSFSQDVASQSRYQITPATLEPSQPGEEDQSLLRFEGQVTAKSTSRTISGEGQRRFEDNFCSFLAE